MTKDNIYMWLLNFILNFIDANIEANVELRLKLMIQDGDCKQNSHRGYKMADFKMAVHGHKGGCPGYRQGA